MHFITLSPRHPQSGVLRRVKIFAINVNSFHSILIHAFHILTLSKHPQTNIDHGCFHPDCSRNDCRDFIIGISISNCDISPGWEVSADTPWLTLNIRFSLRKRRLFWSISSELISIQALCKPGWIQPRSGCCLPRSGAHQHHLLKVVSMFSIWVVLALYFFLCLWHLQHSILQIPSGKTTCGR